MSKLNITNINPQLTLKILKACRSSMVKGIEHVYNRKGDCILAVRWVRGSFIITDNKGRNLKKVLSNKFGYKNGIGSFFTKRLSYINF